MTLLRIPPLRIMLLAWAKMTIAEFSSDADYSEVGQTTMNQSRTEPSTTPSLHLTSINANENASLKKDVYSKESKCVALNVSTYILPFSLCSTFSVDTTHMVHSIVCGAVYL